MTSKPEPITVKVTVNAPIQKAWDYWTKPEHIMEWSFASDDWEAPAAANDLAIGGTFSTTMAAKDGSVEFEFGGTYTNIVDLKEISYSMDDGREVTILFSTEGSTVTITETFDPENENPRDMQREGWQSILNNYKKYVEQA
jgi:uncharacterized protein YndB with AHSA1/START domain